jgi:uncharacterized protein (TIGR02246 family)
LLKVKKRWKEKLMRISLFLITLFISLSSNLTFSQNTGGESADMPSQEAAIRELIAQYLETRAQNNEQGLLALLTEDIDQLTTSGNLRSGRDDMSRGSLASSQNNSGTRSIRIETIRFIKPDVAMVNGRYDIVDRDSGPDSHYLTSILVVMEDGRWLISAIRNMRPTL